MIAPEKPFFLYYAPGACHAPHHAPKEWIEKFKGQFDMGYEAIREQTLARQKEMGIVPKDTELPPINPIGTTETRKGLTETVPAARRHATLGLAVGTRSSLFSRMAEVYAGFMAHADAQIGRLLDYLEETEQLENTLIVLISDNGASGEGGPDGSVNENKFANGIPDSMEENLACSTSSAARRPTTIIRTAGRWRSTRRSRCGSATSSTAAPPIRASCPGRRESRPGARCASSTTTRSTSFPRSSTCSASSRRSGSGGHVQSEFDGISMRYGFDNGSMPSCTCDAVLFDARLPRHLARRLEGSHDPSDAQRMGHFASDTWELYNTDGGPLGAARSRRGGARAAAEMINLWYAEAGATGLPDR